MMRKMALILSVLLLFGGAAWAQSEQESLADAARRIRAERAKKGPVKAKLYTNDNIPRETVLSTTTGLAQAAAEGEGEAAPAAEGEAAPGEGAPAAEAAKECDEQCWRGKFSEQRAKIQRAQQDLDILQREYNLSRTQYYQDPNAAVREQYSNTTAGGRELQDLLNRMNAKKAEIDQLKQGLSALEDDLRKSGGQAGWAR